MTEQTPLPPPTTRPALRRGMVVVAATAAAVLAWLLTLVTGTDLEVTAPDQPPMAVGFPQVLAVAAGASLAGWAALALLRRLTRHGRTAWTALALAVLLLSFLAVASVETTAPARVHLALMHVAVAAVLVPGLRRTVAPASAAGRGGS